MATPTERQAKEIIEPQIKHPAQEEIERLKAEIEEIDAQMTDDQVLQYTIENILMLKNPDVYRLKIKGFHKAFNV